MAIVLANFQKGGGKSRRADIGSIAQRLQWTWCQATFQERKEAAKTMVPYMFLLLHALLKLMRVIVECFA